MNLRDQTIFALSSGRPPAAIAIVRVSGPNARLTLEKLCGQVPKPRTALVTTLRDSAGEAIDESVALFFENPHSATGEDIAEFHVHGGRAVIAAVFDELSKIKNLRPAEPGEFTRRAFENGKLDLTEAEGLDDLIHADTDRQRRQALRQLKGLLGEKADDWRKQIIAASALIEAGVDFSDEGDVGDELMKPALVKISALKQEIENTLFLSAQSERLRDGLVVAIAGPPNAGKSTLLNRLARREAAIVSPHAGTTRDVIEVHLDLDGYPVTLIDTAGIRDTHDPVEQEGVRRARERARTADLVLWMSDANDPSEPLLDGEKNHAPIWRVLNKIDLGTSGAAHENHFPISASRGDGVDELIAALIKFTQGFFGTGESAIITRTRHRNLLRETTESLIRAEKSVLLGDEIVAEELRIGIYSLGRLTGRVDVEDILDVIFREFCIGK